MRYFVGPDVPHVAHVERELGPTGVLGGRVLLDELDRLGLELLDLLGLGLAVRTHTHLLNEPNIFLEELLVLGRALHQFLYHVQGFLIK